MLRQLLITSFTALFFSDESLILINNIRNIDNNIFNLNDSRFSEVLLFGNSSFDNTRNTFILNTTIEYIVSSKRYEVPLYDSFWYSYMAVLSTLYYYHYYYYYYYYSKFSFFHCAISYYHWLSIYIFYHVTVAGLFQYVWPFSGHQAVKG